jgi:type IV secretory pathway VirB2 component (pilin)
MKNKISSCLFIFLLMITNYSFAGTYNIGSGGGTMFTKMTSLLQSCVDFMTGPFGAAVVVLSVCIGCAVWTFYPKEGWTGFCMRGASAGLVLLNVGVWMGVIK